MNTRVLITCRQMADSLESLHVELDHLGWKVITSIPTEQAYSAVELSPLLSEFDGLIAGDDEINEQLLSSNPRLRAICKWGAGIDNIDTQAASRLGVSVDRTPGTFGVAVSEYAVGLAIAVARSIPQSHGRVINGNWGKPVGHVLSGKRAAVIGLGEIGLNTAKLCLAMGMSVVGVEPNDSARLRAASHGIQSAPLHEACRDANAIFVCNSLTRESFHLINNKVIDLMGDPSWIINVARGSVIDESALTKALQDGRLSGAALDVFEKEPLPPSSELRGMETVILGAHNASNASEAVLETSRQAISVMKRLLEP